MKHFVRFTVLTALLLAPQVCGAESVDELLHAAPPDAAFRVVVRDLRGHWANMTASPFAQSLQKSKLGEALILSEEYRQLELAARQVAEALKTDPGAIRDEVFGDVVMFSFWNRRPGLEEKETGLLLSHVRDRDYAKLLIVRLNDAQKNAGELRDVRSVEHHGRTFFRRTKTDGSTEFVALFDSILVFSTHEESILNVIQCMGRVNPSPLISELDRATIRNSFVTLLVDPKRFSADVAEKQKAAVDGEAVFLKTFQKCWSSLDAISVAVRVDRDLVGELTVRADSSKLPTAFRQFAKTLVEPSDVIKRFPADAMAAFALKVDPVTLLATLQEFLAADGSKALHDSLEQGLGPLVGKSMLPNMIKQIGPDLGIAVLAPVESKHVVPPFVVAVRVRPGEKAGEIEQSLLDAIDIAVALLRVEHNKKQTEALRVATVQRDGYLMKVLSSTSFPQGVEPTFALKNGFLLVASHPSAVISFGQPDGAIANRHAGISFSAIAKYLVAHGDRLAELIGDPAAKQRIDRLRTVMGMLERADVVSDSRSNGVFKLSLRLKLSAPLGSN